MSTRIFLSFPKFGDEKKDKGFVLSSPPPPSATMAMLHLFSLSLSLSSFAAAIAHIVQRTDYVTQVEISEQNKTARKKIQNKQTNSNNS